MFSENMEMYGFILLYLLICMFYMLVKSKKKILFCVLKKYEIKSMIKI